MPLLERYFYTNTFVVGSGSYSLEVKKLMKKLDKLVLKSFLGFFVLTFCVAIFVLFIQCFLIYFDELIGKGLGLSVYGQLFFYVSANATPQAFPLAILLASIITLSNLSEHLELTALRSAGISLTRVLLPLFVFTALLSAFVFCSNSYLVPKASLNTISLLFDLREKKPSLSIKEGVFYSGIPGYSIKVGKKLPDQKTLQDIMIYDHTQEKGQAVLTIAQSGTIYMIHDDAYLVIELFDGHNYVERALAENANNTASRIPAFYRSSFKSQKLVIDMESFQLSRTKKELFAHHRRTKSLWQLGTDITEMQEETTAIQQKLQAGLQHYWRQPKDNLSLEAMQAQSRAEQLADISHFKNCLVQKSYHAGTEVQVEGQPPQYSTSTVQHVIHRALTSTHLFGKELTKQTNEMQGIQEEKREYRVARHKMLSLAASCIIVFLIGASLGAIVNRGGLGIAIIIAAALVVQYYIVDMVAEKWATLGMIPPFLGAWLGNLISLPFGLFFLVHAYRDTRLLDLIPFAKLSFSFSKLRKRPKA